LSPTRVFRCTVVARSEHIPLVLGSRGWWFLNVWAFARGGGRFLYLPCGLVWGGVGVCDRRGGAVSLARTRVGVHMMSWRSGCDSGRGVSNWLAHVG
jgi:hypothetical protein